MLKEFLMKKMLQSKLKDVPVETQNQLIAMVEKNPDFFLKIANEIKEKVKTGKSEMDAAMEVMTSHKAEFDQLKK